MIETVQLNMQGGKGMAASSKEVSATLGADSQMHAILTVEKKTVRSAGDQQLTFLSEALPVKVSASRDCGPGSMIRAVLSCSSIWRLLADLLPDGWSGKTCLVSCPPTEGGILAPFSGAWRNAGMGSPTEFLTLSSSEFPSGAVACSLSDILETGELPRRYFLSAKACAGILRRAGKRGKELPPQLRAALEEVARTTSTLVEGS